MQCQNCGEEVGDAKFCPQCGSKVEEISAQKYCPSCGSEVGEAKFCPECGANTGSNPSVPEAAPAQNPVPTSGQTKYSVNEFINKTAEKAGGTEVFELESPYMLDVNLNGRVWAKWGSMVSYIGDIKFKKEGALEGGVEKFLKKKMTGEAAKLMKADGRGHLYLADYGKEIIILNLQNERLYVNGNDILAFEDTVDWDIKMMSSGGSMMSGGLFQIRFQGTGMVAITTHFAPLTLRVTPDQPVFTDPNATVAWSDGVTPEIKTDIGLGTLLGRGSGETFQMKFKGNGFVIVQPFEEIAGGYGQM